MMDGRRVKVLLLRFQFICTKTIRRLDPLRVNIVNNKRTASSCDSAAHMPDVLFRLETERRESGQRNDIDKEIKDQHQ